MYYYSIMMFKRRNRSWRPPSSAICRSCLLYSERSSKHPLKIWYYNMWRMRSRIIIQYLHRRSKYVNLATMILFKFISICISAAISTEISNTFVLVLKRILQRHSTVYHCELAYIIYTTYEKGTSKYAFKCLSSIL